ncbi:MAG: hypothetical protein ABIK62_05165, partial [candidate division WOR-3 bacterium]
LAQVHGLAYQSYRRRTARYFTWRWPAFLVGLRPGPGRRPACAGGSGEDLPRPGDSLPEEMEG